MFSTRPTESSRRNASRIGIGLISRISASSSIGSRSPGGSTPVTIASCSVANARSASVRWPPAARRAESFSVADIEECLGLGCVLHPPSSHQVVVHYPDRADSDVAVEPFQIAEPVAQPVGDERLHRLDHPDRDAL